MTDTILVLGQAYPAAATDTALYTVPSATSAVVSTIAVCNTSATADTIRIRVAVAGAAAANKQYLAYGVTVPGNTSVDFTVGVSLAATDEIAVYATNGTCSFQAFGVQLT